MRTVRLFIAEHPAIFAILAGLTALTYGRTRNWAFGLAASTLLAIFAWGMLAKAQPDVNAPLRRNRQAMLALFWLAVCLMGVAFIYLVTSH